MTRLLVLNNYPLERVWSAVREGRAPANLLYGVDEFARAGYQVDLLSDRVGTRGLRWLARLLRPVEKLLPLGDLSQQRAALAAVGGADLIYAPCQTQTWFLGYLRATGLLSTPLVALAHHPLNPGRLAALRAPAVAAMLRGHDAFPSLSRRIAAEIEAVAPGRSLALPWGPPVAYFPEPTGPGEGIVSAGRTARDFDVLGRAASRVGCPTRIVCTPGCITPGFARFAPNVRVEVEPEQGFRDHRQLVDLYAGARAIAIPLAPAGASLSGLTSLVDALGAGRPVLMTRQPYVDVDIEREGAGFWVEPGDEAGWCERLQRLVEDPEGAARMGRRARAIVADGLNAECFARAMLEIFGRVLDGASSPGVRG